MDGRTDKWMGRRMGVMTDGRGADRRTDRRADEWMGRQKKATDGDNLPSMSQCHLLVENKLVSCESKT